MPQQKQINDAQIRVVSVQIEELAHELQNRAKVLREKFDELYPNLRYADPVKDVAFDRYLITMANVIMLCDQAPSLAYQAREMQSYGKQQLMKDVRNLSRLTPAPAPVAGCPA